jgi:hypothetical protein
MVILEDRSKLCILVVQSLIFVTGDCPVIKVVIGLVMYFCSRFSNSIHFHMLTAAMAVKNRRAEDSKKFIDYKSFCWAAIQFEKVHFEIKERLKIYYHCLENRKVMRFNSKFYLIIINFTIKDICYKFLILNYCVLFGFYEVCFHCLLHFFRRHWVLGRILVKN